MTSMLCKEIMEIIEKDYPPGSALEWDNVGLLAGRDKKEVGRIYIALDATDQVVREAAAWRADMLITHHPLIFGGMKRITDRDFIGRRLLALIQNDISYYAMHTNYDVCGMAELAGKKMGLKSPEVLEVTQGGEEGSLGIGQIGDVLQVMSLKECARKVKEAFGLSNVKVFGDLEGKASRIAICPGSGKSVIGEAIRKGADVLITGDIGHHEGIDSVAQGMAIIDAGHYGVEHIFIEDMKDYLRERLAGVEIAGASVAHPFQIV